MLELQSMNALMAFTIQILGRPDLIFGYFLNSFIRSVRQNKVDNGGQGERGGCVPKYLWYFRSNFGLLHFTLQNVNKAQKCMGNRPTLGENTTTGKHFSI